MKNIIYLIIILVIIGVIIGGAFFINKSSANTEDKITEKISAELSYIEKKIISMINELNNLQYYKTAQVQASEDTSSGQSSNQKEDSSSQSDSSESSSENSNQSSNSNSETTQKFSVQTSPILLHETTIDWKNLTKEAEDLFSSWVTITIDLNSLNVNSENILSFNSNLDTLLSSLKAQDKTNSAICLANMYSLIPAYISETSEDVEKLKILNVKSNIISAYSLVETENWEQVNSFLAQADENLSEIMNPLNKVSQTKQAKINKWYVLLKELIKSANEKNIDIFYLKYISLINEVTV